jgi:5-methylthioadenosine/S-adenosylhomocysteine deaminase
MTDGPFVIHEASWVCPTTTPPIRDGAIAIQGERIVQVGSRSELRDLPGTRIQHAGAAIIPGFVNAHSHIELTVLRGFLENVAFTNWIQRLVRAKYQTLHNEDLAVSARLGAIENLQAGVTAVGDLMDTGAAWNAIREFDLQGVVYQEVFGPAESSAAEALQTLQTKIEKHRLSETETRRIGVSPHAPYTVSESLYRGANEYARARNLPVAVHIAESRDESAFVRDGAGPFAEALRARNIAVNARQMSPLAYLDQLELLRPGVLLIHAIETEDHDLARIQASGASVVHCSKSNAKLGHRIARVRDMLERQIPVGLGTDSVASNNVVDMFEEMRSAIFFQRMATGRVDALSATDAFRMATIGGAECLGLTDKLGSLEAGKRADFAVVNLAGIATQPVFDPIETMVYSACRADVRQTFVGGTAFKADTAGLLQQAGDIARRLQG